MATDPQKTTVKFWQDDQGNNSSMRVMAILALVASIGFSIWLFCKTNSLAQEKVNMQKTIIDGLITKKIPDNQIQTLDSFITNSTNQSINNNVAQSEDSEEITIIWAFLAAAFGGKFAQKFAERNSQTSGNSANPAPGTVP